jgi:hypothetical protein
MAFKKKSGGRKAGIPNKVPAALREMILQALENKGGVAYIERQAEENPVSFMTLLGKILPTTIAPDENTGKLTITWEK